MYNWTTFFHWKKTMKFKICVCMLISLFTKRRKTIKYKNASDILTSGRVGGHFCVCHGYWFCPFFAMLRLNCGTVLTWWCFLLIFIIDLLRTCNLLLMQSTHYVCYRYFDYVHLCDVTIGFWKCSDFVGFLVYLRSKFITCI